MVGSEIITALDIGSSKTCLVMAAVSDTGELNIIGFGNVPSPGMSRGMVVNVDRTVNSIKQAVSDAEHMSGLEVENVILGVSGGIVDCHNTKGIVGVRDNRNHIITEDDKLRARQSATNRNVPPDREIIHTIEQDYTVDGQSGFKDPVGMMGVRLEVNMHIVTVSTNAIQNLLNCTKIAGLTVDEDDIVLTSLASSEAVLSPQEKQMGVALLDFGAGTTDIMIHTGGSVRHTKVLNLGGNSLTRDIFKTLRTTLDSAEELKIQEGCCMRSLLPPDDSPLIIPGMNGVSQEVGSHVLCDILECRVEELLNHIHQEIIVSGCDRDVAGIVLTGGTALLRGVPELAAEIFERPVRVGYPSYMGGLAEMVYSPKFSAVMGLLLHAMKRAELPGAVPMARAAKKNGGLWSGLLNRLLG
ncbi:MAG: cell division protein FtsA [Deltaproteobacteria bacterium]|jgi:cell division protein FtsA|nr:cell division protein FtsA [Deltaproteobacteria bacterium]